MALALDASTHLDTSSPPLRSPYKTHITRAMDSTLGTQQTEESDNVITEASTPVEEKSATEDDVVQQPISQMKDALENADILERIFEYFQDKIVIDTQYEGDVLPSTRHNLLSASLTSKTFFEPAMNVLWRHMMSLSPIFKLIPTLVTSPNGGYVRHCVIDYLPSSKLINKIPNVEHDWDTSPRTSATHATLCAACEIGSISEYR